MSLAKYLEENKIDDIEDDQEFMEAEYNAIQAYCKNCGYLITDEDLRTIKSRGLEKDLMGLQEERLCQDME